MNCPRINCRQFEQRINELLDQRAELRQDAILRRHADSCSRCERLWAVECQLAQGLKLCRLATPLRRSVVPSQSLHPCTPRWVMTIAMASFLAAGVFWWAHRVGQRVTWDGGVAQGIGPADATSSQSRPHWPPQAFGQDNMATGGYPDPADSGSPLASVRNLHLNPLHWQALARFIRPEIVKQQVASGWLEPVKGGIRPLADSFSSALNVLRQTLPGVARRQDETDQKAGDPEDVFSQGRDPIGTVVVVSTCPKTSCSSVFSPPPRALVVPHKLVSDDNRRFSGAKPRSFA